MKKLKLFHRDYRVVLHPAEPSENHGVTDVGKAVIYLEKRDKDAEHIDTVLHEIMHVIWYYMRLPGVEDDMGEATIRPLATGLTTVLRENKSLWKEIGEALYGG